MSTIWDTNSLKKPKVYTDEVDDKEHRRLEEELRVAKALAEKERKLKAEIIRKQKEVAKLIAIGINIR